MPAANSGACMSTHFSSEECPWVPETSKHTKNNVLRNYVLHGSHIKSSEIALSSEPTDTG